MTKKIKNPTMLYLCCIAALIHPLRGAVKRRKKMEETMVTDPQTLLEERELLAVLELSELARRNLEILSKIHQTVFFPQGSALPNELHKLVLDNVKVDLQVLLTLISFVDKSMSARFNTEA